MTVVTEPSARGWLCQVTVQQAGEATRHAVTVTPAALQRWGRGGSPEDVEDLVRRSFVFLLEREAAGSILRQFDLTVISTYFPEYDEQFTR